jgi:hypothetical protein
MPSKTVSDTGGRCCVKWFKHWRSGRIIRAEDYGLRCFPISGCRKKK